MGKMEMKTLALAMMALLSSSCALHYKMPDNRFETSETTGKLWGTHLYAGVGNGKDITLTSSYSQTWADPNNPDLSRENFITLGGDLGLHERIDVGLQYISDLGTVLKGKYQLIGKSGTEGFQTSIAAHAGGGSESISENYHTPTKAELDNSVVGVDIIAGYRFNKIVLIYASFFHDSFSYDIEQTRGTDTRKFEGKSKNTGGTFGASFLFGNTLELTAEYSGANAKSANQSFWNNSFGGIAGFRF